MHTYSTLVSDDQQLITFLKQFSKHSGGSYLIQVLSSQTEKVATGYASLLSAHFPESEIIGHSTRHVIFEGQIHDNSSLIAISQFKHTQLSSAAVALNHHPSQEAQALAEQLNLQPSTKLVISFSQLNPSWESHIYNLFGEKYDIPVCGGLAISVDDRKPWLLKGDTLYHNATVAVALHSDILQVWRNAFSEWNAIGTPLRITEAHGNVIRSINYEPTLSVYQARLSDNRALTLEQIQSFPLQRDNQQICLPTNLCTDGSIEFDQPVALGEEMRLCYNHPSLTLEQVRHDMQTLAERNPESIFIYNCESRLNFIEGATEIKLFDKFDSCCGSFCQGELYRHEQQSILSHSMTYVALSEDSSRPALDVDIDKDVPISPLFHLIRHSIDELNDQRIDVENKLAKQTEKLINSYRIDKHTGLKNRVALQERLKSVDKSEHIITLKLTSFHQVNEKYGYQVADELIHDLSEYFVERLKRKRGNEFVDNFYYIGTAEWAIVFRSNMRSELIKREFSRFVDQIEHINFEPYGLPEVDHLSVSIIGGIASVADFPDISGDELLLKAIDARRQGKARNTHFTNAKDCAVTKDEYQDRLELMGIVSRAILNQRIITFSQPIFAAHSREQASQECLVRIEDEGEIISPGRFLPIIEGTHLYTRLSRYMMESTLGYMANRQESFSINLSPQDMLSDKTLYLLEQAVLKMNDPRRLGIEVLESEQIKDFARMKEVCGHFSKMGVRIVVDDFGSGYSNIDEILRLEPDVIKLDGSLIKTIDKDQKQRQITGQLVQLCKVMNAKTVAEFVHNQEVCRVAEELGVDYLQGFYLAEPTRLF